MRLDIHEILQVESEVFRDARPLITHVVGALSRNDSPDRFIVHRPPGYEMAGEISQIRLFFDAKPPKSLAGSELRSLLGVIKSPLASKLYCLTISLKTSAPNLSASFELTVSRSLDAFFSQYQNDMPWLDSYRRSAGKHPLSVLLTLLVCLFPIDKAQYMLMVSQYQLKVRNIRLFVWVRDYDYPFVENWARAALDGKSTCEIDHYRALLQKLDHHSTGSDRLISILFLTGTYQIVLPEMIQQGLLSCGFDDVTFHQDWRHVGGFSSDQAAAFTREAIAPKSFEAASTTLRDYAGGYCWTILPISEPTTYSPSLFFDCLTLLKTLAQKEQSDLSSALYLPPAIANRDQLLKCLCRQLKYRDQCHLLDLISSSPVSGLEASDGIGLHQLRPANQRQSSAAFFQFLVSLGLVTLHPHTVSNIESSMQAFKIPNRVAQKEVSYSSSLDHFYCSPHQQLKSVLHLPSPLWHAPQFDGSQEWFDQFLRESLSPLSTRSLLSFSELALQAMLMERIRLTILTTKASIEYLLDEVKLERHGIVKFVDMITMGGGDKASTNILELKSLKLEHIIEETCEEPLKVLGSPEILKTWMDKINDMDLTAITSTMAPPPSFRLPNNHEPRLTLNDLFTKLNPTGSRIPILQVIQKARLQLEEYCTCLVDGEITDPRVHKARLNTGSTHWGSLTPYVVVLIGGSKFYVQRLEPREIHKLSSLPEE